MTFQKGHIPYNKGERGKLLESNCKICDSRFSYHVGSSKGIYCSKECYRSDKEVIKNQAINARLKQKELGISQPKITDEELLTLWEQFKNSNSSMKSVFKKCGYKRVPPKRLLKILPLGEYDKYKIKNKFKNHGYLYKRGTHYERKARKSLELDGYKVVRSSASRGTFDLWALNEQELKLIQVKATKSLTSFTKLVQELELVKVPVFCRKELWIWRDRSRTGWEKVIVP